MNSHSPFFTFCDAFQCYILDNGFTKLVDGVHFAETGSSTDVPRNFRVFLACFSPNKWPIYIYLLYEMQLAFARSSLRLSRFLYVHKRALHSNPGNDDILRRFFYALVERAATTRTERCSNFGHCIDMALKIKTPAKRACKPPPTIFHSQ